MVVTEQSTPLQQPVNLVERREDLRRLTINELEDTGLSWRDAEGRAFVEIWSQVRASADVERN